MTTHEAFKTIIPLLPTLVHPSTARTYKRRFLRGQLTEELMDGLLRQAGFTVHTVKTWNVPEDFEEREQEAEKKEYTTADELLTLEIGTKVLIVTWGEEGEISDNEDYSQTGAYTVRIGDDEYFVEAKDIQVLTD